MYANVSHINTNGCVCNCVYDVLCENVAFFTLVLFLFCLQDDDGTKYANDSESPNDKERETHRHKKETQMMLRFDCFNEHYLIDDRTPYAIKLITYLSWRFVLQANTKWSLYFFGYLLQETLDTEKCQLTRASYRTFFSSKCTKYVLVDDAVFLNNIE